MIGMNDVSVENVETSVGFTMSIDSVAYLAADSSWREDVESGLFLNEMYFVQGATPAILSSVEDVRVVFSKILPELQHRIAVRRVITTQITEVLTSI